jgi:hypothetical protein
MQLRSGFVKRNQNQTLLLSKVLTLPSVFEFLVNTRDILRLRSTSHALKEALTNRPELFSNADFYQFERTALDFWKFLRSEKEVSPLGLRMARGGNSTFALDRM